MDGELWHDHTVRPLVGEDWASDSTRDFRGAMVYDGPDLSDAFGAGMLCKRLERFWNTRGEPRTFAPYFTGVDEGQHPVFGIRETTPSNLPPLEFAPPPDLQDIGPAPRAIIKAIIRETLNAYPGVTYDMVMREHKGCVGQRYGSEAEARSACVHAVQARYPHFTIEQLARVFGIHHTSILYILSPARREDARRRECQRKRSRAKTKHQ